MRRLKGQWGKMPSRHSDVVTQIRALVAEMMRGGWERGRLLRGALITANCAQEAEGLLLNWLVNGHVLCAPLVSRSPFIWSSNKRVNMWCGVFAILSAEHLVVFHQHSGIYQDRKWETNGWASACPGTAGKWIQGWNPAASLWHSLPMFPSTTALLRDNTVTSACT